MNKTSPLESVRLQNLESHKDTILEFDPGINVIVGDTSSGKSAILRALDWVLNNSVQKNEAWWNEGTKNPYSCTLAIDGEFITREVSLNFNGYRFSTRDPLDKIGKGASKEAQDFINLAPVNFSHQHEAYFLLNDTSGQVAKYFNGIIKLDLIDAVKAKASEDYKAVSAQVTQLEKEVATKTKEIEKWAYIERVQELSVAYQTLKAELNVLQATKQVVMDFLNTYSELSKKSLEVCALIEKLAPKVDSYKKIQGEVTGIAKSLEEAQRLQSEFGTKAQLREHNLSLTVKLPGVLELYKQQRTSYQNLRENCSWAETVLEQLEGFNKRKQLFGRYRNARVVLADLKEAYKAYSGLQSTLQFAKTKLEAYEGAKKTKDILSVAIDVLSKQIPRCDKCGAILGSQGGL